MLTKYIQEGEVFYEFLVEGTEEYDQINQEGKQFFRNATDI